MLTVPSRKKIRSPQLFFRPAATNAPISPPQESGGGWVLEPITQHDREEGNEMNTLYQNIRLGLPPAVSAYLCVPLNSPISSRTEVRR